MRSPQRLVEVCHITMGQAPEGESYNTDGHGLPLIAGAGDFGERLPMAKKFTSNPGKVCEAGDIVLGIRASIGEKVVADRAYCLGRGVAGLRAKPTLDCRYLWHWLTHAAPMLTAKAKGATFKQVNREDIQELMISPPPLPEQRRIAEILDKADAMRAKRRAAVTQLDTLSQPVFLDMFGDPSTNPRGFPTKPLASLVREDDKINYGVVQPGDDLDGGIPLVRVGDLYEGRVSHTSLKRIAPSIEAAYKRSRLRGDEILVSCVGSVGVVAAVEESQKGFNIARAVARVPVAESIERSFVIAYLKTDYVQRYFVSELRTVSQPTLNIKQLSETRIFIPPIDLQRHFSNRAAAVEALKGTHRAHLGELDALFASLQHRAFRGEL